MNSLLLVSFLALSSLAHGFDPKWAEEAAETLMQYYDQNNGLFENGWWTGANAHTAIMDYMLLSGSRKYIDTIRNTYDKARNHNDAHDFANWFIDDSGWWGLAWIRAYDLTKNTDYLSLAKRIADYMYAYHDNVCNGGLYWNGDKKTKNAISNELYIKLAASVHNREFPGARDVYLEKAKEVYNWMKNSGMIDSDHLIKDGLDGLSSCPPSGQKYTYNQGVILGALVELHKATNDQAYLNDAKAIADAVVHSDYLSPNGILADHGESDECNNDGASFKGAFIRGLGELNRALGNRPYQDYIERNAQAAHDHGRDGSGHYGDHWAGPVKGTGHTCQHSALDLMNAALK